MILFVAITIFSFEIILLLCHSISSLVSKWKCRDYHKVFGLRNELKAGLDELHKINPQDAFAKFARAQRKVNKLKDELKGIIKERNYLFAKIKYGMKAVTYIFYVLFSFCIIFLYRNKVCTQLPSHWLMPLGKVLSFPLNEPGVISVPIWMAICRFVSKKMLT